MIEIKDIIEAFGEDSLECQIFTTLKRILNPDAHKILYASTLMYGFPEWKAPEGPLTTRFNLIKKAMINLSEVGVFTYTWFLEDEDGDAFVVFSKQDIEEARKTGVLYDPDTGKSIPNWQEVVEPYFCPTDKVVWEYTSAKSQADLDHEAMNRIRAAGSWCIVVNEERMWAVTEEDGDPAKAILRK